MEKLRPKIGVNVFVVKDNKLLLGKRKNTVGDGYWGLPGGHLELMESLTAGAKRELEEETGLTADRLVFSHIINDPLPEEGTHYIHIDFLAEGVHGEAKVMEPEKCAEWKWFDLNNLPPYDEIFLGHRKIIPAFINKITFID
jgi:8-oxo-dGTP diphosphatase